MDVCWWCVTEDVLADEVVGEEFPFHSFSGGPGVVGGIGGVGTEASGEVFGGGPEQTGPAVGDDAEEGGEEHDVLDAGLKILRAGWAVEDGVGGVSGGLEGGDCLGAYRLGG